MIARLPAHNQPDGVKPMDVLGILAAVFMRANFQIYLVGGSVRDRLLGRNSKDLDLTTNARPKDIKRLLSQTNPDHVFDIGARFGTIGAGFDQLAVEITTYRTEWYPDRNSRHPEVKFGDNLEEDLARRDFTINAIAQDITTGRIVDPYKGARDIARKQLRAVGSARDRFTEDPLRMLRAIRLSTELSFEIHADTLSAIRDEVGSMQFVSSERIRDEFLRILLSDHPAAGIATMMDLGVARFAVPELYDLRSTIQEDTNQRSKDVLSHTLRVLGGVRPDKLLRLSALFHDIGKPATRSTSKGKVHFFGHEHVGARMTRDILTRLRFDKNTLRDVCNIVSLHMRSNLYDNDWSDGAIRRFMREVGVYRDRLLELSRSDITSYRAQKIEAGLIRVAELEARCNRLAGETEVQSIDSPLDGNELKVLFDRPAGPWIKAIKDYLLGLVLDGELSQEDKDTAAKLALKFDGTLRTD